MTYQRRQFLRLAGLAGAVLVVNGCDLFKGSGPYQPSETQEIRVILKEWEIIPKKMLAKAGRVRFVVRNDGSMDHGFEIEGEIAGEKFEEEIEPFEAGRTKTLELDLAAGDYEVYCQVPGHKELGMVGELNVREA